MQIGRLVYKSDGWFWHEFLSCNYRNSPRRRMDYSRLPVVTLSWRWECFWFLGTAVQGKAMGETSTWYRCSLPVFLVYLFATGWAPLRRKGVACMGRHAKHCNFIFRASSPHVEMKPYLPEPGDPWYVICKKLSLLSTVLFFLGRAIPSAAKQVYSEVSASVGSDIIAILGDWCKIRWPIEFTESSWFWNR